MARKLPKSARIAILVLSLVVLLLAAWLLYRWYEGPDARTEAAGAPMEISAEQLAAAYDEDAAGADIRYGDRPLRVSGRVHSITAGSGGPVIVMGGDDPLLTITARFDRSQVDRVVAMTLNSQATILCTRTTLVQDNPALGDCRFVEAGS